MAATDELARLLAMLLALGAAELPAASPDAGRPPTNTNGDAGLQVSRSSEFNAADFGAVGDDATDNTAAFSRCLEALVAAGGGRMRLPDGVYRGRIIIPPVSRPLPSWISVEITGASAPTPVFGTIGDFPLQSHGTIVKCLAEAGPAVISAPPSTNALYGGFSAVRVSLRNLDLRTYDNPGIGGVDLQHALQCELQDVFINTGVYNVRASEPTRAACGLITPGINNAAWTVLRNVTVTGYRTGIVVNEHTDGDNVVIGSNVHGLEFVRAHHASRFGRVCSCRNVNTLTVSGAHGFSIAQLDIERPGPNQTDTRNAWQATASDVNDPGNLGVADLNYWVVIGIVGAQDVFTKKGGTGIQARRVGAPPPVDGRAPADRALRPASASAPGVAVHGDDASKTGDTAPAPELMDKARQGDAAAQLALALRYRDGKGVKQDHAEALRWAHRAAERGNAAARDFVGFAFLRGDGVARSPEIAAGYFRAAAPESATAANNLALCCFAAQGTPQDIPQALALWKSAADRGKGRAASTAAMVYLAGEGVPADPAEARRLAEQAAALNDPSGLVVLGELQFRAGQLDAARNTWTQVSRRKPVGPTGQPEQPSDEMAAQQGADLLKLIDYRGRKPEPGAFALVPVPHIQQGWNNCGATSCAMFARHQGAAVGGWDYKRLCPSPLGTGTDWGDLVDASKKIGLRWKLVTFPPDDDGFEQAAAFARGELDAGRPLVIDFKFTGPRYPNGEAGHTLLLVGYIAAEDLYILCNPAIATPGLELMTAADLKRYWRSDHYGALSHGVLSRPAIVVDRS